MEEAQRQLFFKVLLDAVMPLEEEENSTQGTFAACEDIKPAQGLAMMTSLQVEGAGELQLPLSAADKVKLRGVCEQAPFGRGSTTLVDTSVRRCWQVDASKVSFPKTPTFLSDIVQALAKEAVRALGVDGAHVGLEAHLYKLLLYEVGDHFTFHRDTEKERGMFATMILQLPTAEGYTGGELLVKHNNEVKTFNNSQMTSSVGFRYIVFFADCLHELRKIESGTRLCLAFNLVRQDSYSESIPRSLMSLRVQKAEAALEPWLKAAAESRVNYIGKKVAFPLQHKYTEANLSFAGLKGDDRDLAEVLMNVRDQNKQKCLDLYLCLVFKYQRGIPSHPERLRERDWHRNQGWHSNVKSSSEENSDDRSSHEEFYSMDGITEENIEFKNWIGLDDETMSMVWIDNLRIDFEKEGVVEEPWEDFPFGGEPDESEYEAYTGNAGPSLEYWYRRAMLVVWPKALSISVLCQSSVSDALALLQINDQSFHGQLHQIVGYCIRNPLQVWDRRGDAKTDSISPRLLTLCARAVLWDETLQILQLLGKGLFVDTKIKQTFRIGVRNPEVARAIATAVQVFGWELASSSIIDLVQSFALAQSGSFVIVAKQLLSQGNRDAGEHVAHTIFAVFEARIALLESQMPAEPVFHWRQHHARLPEDLGVESFLVGPNEKLTLKGFGSIASARAFANKYCIINGAGYSVTATTGGKGRDSFCEITKTRRLFDVAKENWSQRQGQVRRLRLLIGTLRAAIPIVDNAAVTAPDGSGQQDEERPTLNAVTGSTTNNGVETSPAVFMDLTVSTFRDGPPSKRSKSGGGKIEFIDLTTDDGENPRG